MMMMIRTVSYERYREAWNALYADAYASWQASRELIMSVCASANPLFDRDRLIAATEV